MKAEIIVTDNEVIMSTPMGGNVYNNSLIITKEAFIECYEKWIKPIKHGRWIWKDHYLVCSECGEENDRKNYCPNCGARMDGGENG